MQRLTNNTVSLSGTFIVHWCCPVVVPEDLQRRTEWCRTMLLLRRIAIGHTMAVQFSAAVPVANGCMHEQFGLRRENLASLSAC